MRNYPVALAAVILLFVSLSIITGDQTEKKEQAENITLSEAKGEKGVRYVKNKKVNLNVRKGLIKKLSECGDTGSVDTLFAIAKQRTYLNRFAAESLGNVKNKAEKVRIKTFFEENLNNEDALYAAACIRGYTDLVQKKAADKLIQVLEDNRERKDGYEELVCAAAVVKLGELASKKAVTALGQQLERAGRNGWTLEYGSVVCQALVRIGDKKGALLLRDYADRLAAERPDDPVAGPYFDRKIDEALQAAAALEGGE